MMMPAFRVGGGEGTCVVPVVCECADDCENIVSFVVEGDTVRFHDPAAIDTIYVSRRMFVAALECMELWASGAKGEEVT
jgi:hypothetical protein